MAKQAIEVVQAAEPLVDACATSRAAGLSPAVIRRAARLGRIPAYRVGGVGPFVFKISEVLAALQPVATETK